MKQKMLARAVYGAIACTVAAPLVQADELSDLKAAIAAQKAQLDAQQAKLEALEKSVTSVKTAQAQVPVLGGQAPQGSGPMLPLPGPLASGQGLFVQTSEYNIGVYGLIDATIGTVNNANAAGESRTGFTGRTGTSAAPWFSGSRWGITGTRKLNDSLNAIFKLESEFVLNTGSADDPNLAFGRDAWVGFQGDGLGKLTFGRQNALARDFAAIYSDPYQAAAVRLEEGGFTNTNNFKQLVYYAGSASGTRMNSGVVWKKAFANGLTAGLGYQFGETTSDMATGSTGSVALAYSADKFNVAGFYTQANVAGRTDTSSSIGGNYAFGPLRAHAGYFHYTGNQGALGDRTDNAYTISFKYTQNENWDYELGYQSARAKNAAISGSGTTANTLNPFAAVASTLTTVGSGNRNTTYGSVFYHYNRFVDLYVAADYLKLTNNYKVATTNGFKNQTEVAVGTRIKF